MRFWDGFNKRAAAVGTLVGRAVPGRRSRLEPKPAGVKKIQAAADMSPGSTPPEESQDYGTPMQR